MHAVKIARVTAEPLDVTAHFAAVDDAAVGAMASFVGVVRDHDPEAAGRVQRLEYSAHPDAESTLHDIALRAVSDRGAIVAVSHRVGSVPVGEAAVVIVVGTAHRATAFEVCREIIEEIKRELPVWKRQIEADGTAGWKGLGG